MLQLAGANVEANFKLLHYGPFSIDLARSADFLSLMGTINEESLPIGVYGTYQSIFSLPRAKKNLPRWSKKYSILLKSLDEYSTTELEVASTIGYFIRMGLSEREAIHKTKFMKPTKTIAPVVKKAQAILKSVNSARS